MSPAFSSMGQSPAWAGPALLWKGRVRQGRCWLSGSPPPVTGGSWRPRGGWPDPLPSGPSQLRALKGPGVRSFSCPHPGFSDKNTWLSDITPGHPASATSSWSSLTPGLSVPRPAAPLPSCFFMGLWSRGRRCPQCIWRSLKRGSLCCSL